MLWTHPLLLGGLAALAVPVIIHLMMRAQGRKLRFSTLRFLPQSQPARERKRIRHWPLLLLRLLLIALLVAAFARPYWPNGNAQDTRQRARAVVVVLDRTASMQAREGGGTRWDAALASLHKLLGTLDGGDQVALVGVAQSAEVLAPWGASGIAEHAVAALKPTSESGQLADGLRVAAGLLARAPANGEIVVISDLQKSGCVGVESVPLPAGTRCDVRPVCLPDTANVGITGFRSPDSTGATLTVNLSNFSAQSQQALPVKALLDGQPLFENKVDLAAHAAADLTIPLAAAKPGWHTVQVGIATGDVLPADDIAWAGVFIPQPITVLVSETHPEKRNFARASYFVTSALDPNYSDDPNVPTPPGPFVVSVADEDKVAAALSSRPSVVILPPLTVVSDGLGEALAAYVQAGGGLLAWVTAGADTVGYNNRFSVFSPASLIESQEFQSLVPGGGGGWHLGWWNRDSALFGPIGQAGRGDLTLPEFKQRVQLTAAPDAEVLATFEDKTPFLILRRVGQGRVLLVNASADTQSSDWPIHKTYLPMVQRMTYFLAHRDPQAGFAMGPSVAPSHHAQLEFGSASAGHRISLVPGGSPDASLQPDASGTARGVDLETPGAYLARDEQANPVTVVTVNFPAAESDLSSLRPDEFSGKLQFTAPVVARFHESTAAAAHREIWPWLLFILLPLLILELFWANCVRT